MKWIKKIELRFPYLNFSLFQLLDSSFFPFKFPSLKITIFGGFSLIFLMIFWI